jgi:hypothetical protein
MSIWSNLFPPKPAAPAPPPEAEQTPEAVLSKALQKAEEERVAAQKATNQLIQQQLRAWGEDDLDIPDPDPPFQDPLGHLTFEQQKAYLANPPPEYMQSLANRAAAREKYEKTLFLADPWTFWRYGCSTRPDFSRPSLPSWFPWRKWYRDQVIDKLRRYDQRFQKEVQLVYEEYDSEEWRSNVRKDLTEMYAAIARRAKKREKRDRKEKFDRKRKGNMEKAADEELGSEPPKVVIERQVYRKAILHRNRALNSVWRKHLYLLQKFEDLTEEGETVSEVASREYQGRRQLERIDEEVFEEWAEKPIEEKVESVDWKRIHSEL